MKIVWLPSVNQVGIEIIEYVGSESERCGDSFEYRKSGITHISVTDPDIGRLYKKFSNIGGKLEIRLGK